MLVDKVHELYFSRQTFRNAMNDSGQMDSIRTILRLIEEVALPWNPPASIQALAAYCISRTTQKYPGRNQLHKALISAGICYSFLIKFPSTLTPSLITIKALGSYLCTAAFRRLTSYFDNVIYSMCESSWV